MSGERRQFRQKLTRGLLLFIVYAAIACIITWPLANRITTHLPGGSDDTFVHFWNSWWVQHAVNAGQTPFYTTYLFFPTGVNLVTHNIAWFNVLPWLVLEPVLGGIVAYNIALLLNLALCGLTAYWLAQKLTADSRAAFLAGLIYLAWPFRLSQLDHPNLLATQWLPLFFLFLIMTIRQGRWRDSLLAGLFFALVGFTRWQQLIPATLMGLIYFAFSTPQWLPRERRYILTRLFGAGAVALLLLSPAIVLLLRQQSDASQIADVLREGEESIMQTDVLAYVTPDHLHPVFGEATQAIYDHYYADRSPARRYAAYIGLVALCLALAGVWHQKCESWPWILMAVFLILLALGPLLRVNGRFYPNIPTFYGLLSPLGIFRLMRVPDRFNMFLALPVAVLAAYGAARLLATSFLSSRWRARLATGLLSGLVCFEYLATPVPLIDAVNRPPFLAQLAQEPGDFAIMNLPFDPLRAKVYMFDQTIHHRPILQGKTARLPNQAYGYIDDNPWLNTLHTVNEMSPTLPDVGQQLDRLAQEQIRYMIIYKNLVGADRVSHWQRYLLTRPHYEDGQILVYTTTPEPGDDYELQAELLPGVGPVKTIVSATCLMPGQTFEVDVGWGWIRPLSQPLATTLSLVDTAGVVQQTDQFPLDASASNLFWDYYRLDLLPSLSSGEYTLQLGLVDTAAGNPTGESISLQALTVQTDPCNLATESQAVDANAVFGNQMRLVEYEVQQAENALQLRLYWRAEQRMATDYKVFIHVFDPATGIPLAQDDAMPHRGAYPTTFWWPGELVDDGISISLNGVPAGEYGLAIGVYEPTSGERLVLVNGRGKLIEDGRFILQETVTIK